MSLPGAGPPNSAERSAAALKSQSVNTGRGAVQTRSSVRRPATEPYHAPASGGGVLMQTAFQHAAGSGSDPIVWGTDLGGIYDIGPTSDYVDLTGGVLTLLQSCWVQISVRADMSGVTAGVPVEMFLSLSGDPIGEVVRSPARPDHVARCFTDAGPYWFDVAVSDPTIYVGMNADDSSGSFSSAVVKVVVLSGITP